METTTETSPQFSDPASTSEAPVEQQKRKSYPSDVSDEEWAFIAPYLILMTLDAPQRLYDLRDIFDALRWIVRSGSPWRYLPGDFPPWQTVYQQTKRWIRAGVFQAIVDDLREMLRKAAGKKASPSAVIIDGRTMQSTCESGPRAGYDGAKKKKGSKVHMVVDTLGNLLDVIVTPANVQERSQIEQLAKQIQELTGNTVELAFVDAGYTGEATAKAAEKHGIKLEVVKLPEAKKGFVLLPRRWVVERSFGWVNRFRRLVRDYERLQETLCAMHFIAFAILMLAHLPKLLPNSQ